MDGKPEPGDVLLWRGSHDVLGKKDPVILVEPAVDPQFWLVAEIDEQGLPTPYTFAVPVEELVPVEDSVPARSARRLPRLPGDQTKGALLRVAVSMAAAASFALGALSLTAHQPVIPFAEGLRPAAQAPNALGLGGSPQAFGEPSLQTASFLIGLGPPGSRGGRSVLALAPPSALGGPSSGGTRPGADNGRTSGGADNRGGGGGGGSNGGGGPPVGDVAAPDTHPGNSGSAPGHGSTPGNSGSAPGHNSTHGNSGSPPGHD